MYIFTVSKFSVVAPLFSDDGIFPTEKGLKVSREVKKLCNEKLAEVHFLANDKVRFIRWNNRLMKVPKKCQNSLDDLAKWIRERIEKA